MDSATPQQAEAVLLFTTFPVLSETFLQREVRALSNAGASFRIVSLWGGESEWEGIQIERFGGRGILLGILCLLIWLIKQPKTVFQLIGLLWKPRQSGLLNWGENLLGACYGLRHAGRYASSGTGHCHAVWSSAPAMAAYAIHKLTGTPFSTAAHAYDLFENGGDGWMGEKLAAAEWARSSTQAGVNRLIELGARPNDVLLARRGLTEIPEFIERPALSTPLRLLSVGRMVEKMGYERQIPFLSELKNKGIPFRMVWIGDGPERPGLEEKVNRAGLQELIEFKGRLAFAEVEKAYRASDILLFTGKVDSRGDRAGLPNAVAESMAYGTLVFATDVGAVREVVDDQKNGFVWQGEPSTGELEQLLNDPELQASCRLNAWEWIRDNYDINKNLEPLIRLISA
ncbi:MAG: glycosyltransferase family 4 protein [Puniceicoccaceae bacterium]